MSGNTKRKLTLIKIHLFVLLVEKYVEDVKQDEKDVLDLLEAIMKLPGLVKEELRLILFKMSQFGSKISKIRVSTCWMVENLTDSRRRSMPAFSLVSFKPKLTLPDPINPKNAGFWRRQAPFTLVYRDLYSTLNILEKCSTAHFARSCFDRCATHPQWEWQQQC